MYRRTVLEWADDNAGKLLVAFFLSMLVFGLYMVHWQINADCKEFKNWDIQHVPVRCLPEYTK